MERFYIWGQGVNERKVHLQKIVSLIFVHFCVHIVGSLFLVNSIRQTVLDEFASNNNNFKLSRPYYVQTLYAHYSYYILLFVHTSVIGQANYIQEFS